MFKTVVAVLCAAVFAAPAYATTSRNATLEERAAQVRGTPFEVWCESDQENWNRNQPATALAVTFQQYGAMILAPTECDRLNAPRGTETFDVAAYIFLHELMHSIGISSEWEAECMNLFVFRYELRRWWGYTAAQAETAWRRGLTAHNAQPAVYQGCLPIETDMVSVANRL